MMPAILGALGLAAFFSMIIRTLLPLSGELAFWITFPVIFGLLPDAVQTRAGIENAFAIALFIAWGFLTFRAVDWYLFKPKRYTLIALGILAAVSVFSNPYSLVIFAALGYLAYTADNRLQKSGLCFIEMPGTPQEHRYAKRIYFQESIIPFAAWSVFVLSIAGPRMSLIDLLFNTLYLLLADALIRRWLIGDEPISGTLNRLGIACETEVAVRGAGTTANIQQHLDNQ